MNTIPFYLSIRCETIMTRPIEHDKIRDALFFQLEPILSAFERAYNIDPEDSFEAIHILEKLLEERLKKRAMMIKRLRISKSTRN